MIRAPVKLQRVHKSVYRYHHAYIIRNETVSDGHTERWQVNLKGKPYNRRTRAECMDLIDAEVSKETK